MTATHSQDHRQPVEGCYLCKLRSVSISPAAMPTRQDVRYSATDNLEKGWQKDIPAYKRLVADGLQPARVDGCAEIEAQAKTKTEVEEGTIYTPEQRKTLEAATEHVGAS